MQEKSIICDSFMHSIWYKVLDKGIFLSVIITADYLINHLVFFIIIIKHSLNFDIFEECVNLTFSLYKQ